MLEKVKEKCLNCGTELHSTDKFCPECGQKKTDLNLTFTHFVNEFLSNNFNVDSKIFRTLKVLVFYPGKLSKEFLEGKRSSYVTPVRLYLIISLVYFTVLSFTNIGGVKIHETGREKDRVVFGFDETDTTSVSELIAVDSISVSDTVVPSSFENFLKSKLKRLQNKQGRKEFNAILRSYISMGMFILIPLTALILLLLFYKNSFYIQHLVFIIHLQSLMFIIFTFFNLLSLIADWNVFAIINSLFFIFLLLVWIKKFYDLKWGKAIWKSILFIFLYGIVFIVFLAAVASIGFYNL